jgi:AcrR family transcriptional regulator
MSPYPTQTNRQSIILAARQMIEQDGISALSLGKLARRLGIKAPSLYRHIANKTALLQAVNEAVFEELFQAYDRVLAEGAADLSIQLLDLARVHRAFAHAFPNTYLLAYSSRDPAQAPDPDLLLQAALKIQAVIAPLSGPDHSLAALRGLLALAHGYVTLELHGQFQRGGDLDADFDAALLAYLQGWRQP